MRPRSYRSPKQQPSLAKARCSLSRPQSIQSKSQKISHPSASHCKSQRQASKESSSSSRKKQKILTEQRTSNSSNNVVKLAHHSKRYRFITQTKKVKSAEANEWGVSSKKMPQQPNMIEEQRQSIAKIQKMRNSIQLGNKQATIRYRSQARQRNQKLPYRLKPIPLKAYVQYIHGTDTELSIGFDFTYLKRLSRSQANEAIDFSSFSVMQSIQLCALDVLSQPQQGNGSKLLREYSLLYFRHFDKNLMEVILVTQYYKLAQSLFLTFFTHTRYYFVVLHEISQEFFQHSVQLKKALTHIIDIQKIIYYGKAEIEQQSNYVAQTLKILKITKELERRISQMSGMIRILLQKTQQNERVKAILKEFEPLEKLSNFQGQEFQFLAQTEIVVGWNYFSIPPIPYLPSTTKPYTIVLSIESVLIYYDEAKKILMYRPYLDHLLARLSYEFEVVAFSNEMKGKADQFIDCIEKNNRYFSYRLYKEHLSLKNGNLVKDLSKLGRDTERILMVDAWIDAPGVWRIPQFRGSSEDRSLIMLLNEMITLLRGHPQDVSKLGGYFGTLQHIEEQLEDDITISTNQ